jgi:hypothetical protein
MRGVVSTGGIQIGCRITGLLMYYFLLCTLLKLMCLALNLNNLVTVNSTVGIEGRDGELVVIQLGIGYNLYFYNQQHT